MRLLEGKSVRETAAMILLIVHVVPGVLYSSITVKPFSLALEISL